MKILASEKNERCEVVYLCEISHTEIEKFLNQYYNKLKYLQRGDSDDLGKGYDFLIESKKALDKTQELISSNKQVINTILTGINFLGVKDGVETI